MRVIVVGATGNVGSAVVRALAREPAVDEVIGLARRPGGPAHPKVQWKSADVLDRATLDLRFAGADAVIHLAWAIQPARNRAQTRAIDVDGSRNVFSAAAFAGVGTLIHASSVGAYGPVADDRRVREDQPATGIDTSFYSRDKAAVEAILDTFEARHPRIRCVRLRPSLIFQRSAAEEIRRLFAGPFVPTPLLRVLTPPVVPHIAAVRFQAVHSDDVADAYRRVLLDDGARGAYNVAAEPVLGTRDLAEILGARPLRVPLRPVRMLAGLTYRAHLQPTEAGWLDLATRGPLLDTTRIRDELGWAPQHTGRETLAELLAGLRDGAGADTAPLDSGAGGPGRVRELLTGIGSRR